MIIVVITVHNKDIDAYILQWFVLFAFVVSFSLMPLPWQTKQKHALTHTYHTYEVFIYDQHSWALSSICIIRFVCLSANNRIENIEWLLLYTCCMHDLTSVAVHYIIYAYYHHPCDYYHYYTYHHRWKAKRKSRRFKSAFAKYWTVLLYIDLYIYTQLLSVDIHMNCYGFGDKTKNFHLFVCASFFSFEQL